MGKTLSVFSAATAFLLAVSVFVFTNAPLAHAASSLFGGATMNGGEVTLVSDGVDPFSGISFNDAVGLSYPALTTLSADYNVTDDDCGAGSPRFQIQIDTNADNVSDGNVHVAFGPSPNFTDCALGWQSTGNVIGNNDAGRYDYSAFGGSPFTTYSNMPASVANGTVRNISIVVDSGWSAAASGGDGEQTILIDNVQINNTTYDFTPPPVTVTIIKYVDGMHATTVNANNLSFPMQSSWDADNLGAGAGSYALGPAGFNSPNAYEAVTSDMTSGADYATNEDMTGPNVGASCADGKPFALAGYSTGDSEAEAAGNPVSLTSPAFTDITSDKYVIVWNEPCPQGPPVPPANACDTPNQAPIGFTLQYGTTGHDTVTIAPNTMFVGRGGNDRVTGGNGNFIVCTGSGNDTIKLGNGDSTVRAGAGNNMVTVGNGTGVIETGSGNDTIKAGNGERTISAGAGNNNVTTGGGSQTITTGSGHDTIRAGAGDDVITSGAGNDTVNGEGGNDTISTGSGNDVINGGAGASDSCNAGSGNNVVSNCEL